MKIYLLDRNPRIIEEWQILFDDCEDLFIICDDFKSFMDTYDVECVVSPGNARGVMAGGYDRAISEYFGWGLTKKVQQFIIENFGEFQPVGSSQIFAIDHTDKKLIHTPTMLFPSKIEDYNVLYSCTKTCLNIAKNNNIESIVIPAFGGACGQVPANILAKQMHKAYKDWINCYN